MDRCCVEGNPWVPSIWQHCQLKTAYTLSTHTLLPSPFHTPLPTLPQTPASILLALTVPVIDKDEEDHNWNKWLNVLHCATAPVFIVLITTGIPHARTHARTHALTHTHTRTHTHAHTHTHTHTQHTHTYTFPPGINGVFLSICSWSHQHWRRVPCLDAGTNYRSSCGDCRGLYLQKRQAPNLPLRESSQLTLPLCMATL